MIRLSTLMLFILTSTTLLGQGKSDEYIAFMKNGIEYQTNGKDTIIIVEPMPEFKGGMEKLGKYLGENLRYPKKAQKAHIEGKVLVSFIVAKDGTIRNAKIAKSVHPALDKEALRVVKKMPKWKPGEQNKNPISVSYSLPIDFKL